MGWEVMKRPAACPCGAGLYQRLDWEEDWGRSRTDYQMDCPRCRERYALWVIPAPPERRHEDSDWAAWIPKEQDAQRLALAQQVRDTRQAALDVAWKAFGQQLLDHIARARFKTRMHAALVEQLGPPVPTFRRFDRAVKEEGLLEGVRRMIELEHLPTLLRTYGDTEGEVTASLNQHEEAGQASVTLTQTLRRSAQRI